jgi:transcriptional regulator with XRE-family HTH domain
MLSSAAGSDTTPKAYFGVLLRQWRAARRISQLTLALDADISTRHLSCVETGRAQPSREMVVRLAEALEIPLRERNTLLLAAGYAALYRQTSLDAPEMEAARQAVDLLLRQQEPYPGIVIDRYWNTLRESVAARIIQRVHREVAANPSDETMKCFLEELLGYPAVPSRWRVLDIDDSPPPFLTINYRWNDSTLRFFSTLTTFGSPQDVALQEMRIESFFPADEATRAALTAAR